MLVADSPVDAGPLTVFRDHVSPTTFHYLPGTPRLAEPGGVSLLLHRGGAAGGLLTLTVELSPPARDLALARDALSRRSGVVPDLVPVLFDEGTVRLTTLGVQRDTPVPEQPAGRPRLVERVLGSTTPALLGTGRAVFAVRLDAEGAVAVRDSLLDGTLPAIVAYELTYRGLLPASGLRATVDHATAYEHLRTRAAAGTLWFRADLESESEALERSGAITITDVDYSGSDPAVLAARRTAALDTLHELVETLFFRPATSPASVPALDVGADGAWAAHGRPSAAFVLREVRQDEEQEATCDRAETSVAVRRAAPQGPLALDPGVDPRTRLLEADLVHPDRPTEVTVAAVQDADWRGVQAVRVDLRGGEVHRTVVLTPEHPEGAAVLPSGGVDVLVTALTAPGPDDLVGPPRTPTQARLLDTASVVVDPRALAGRRTVEVVLGVVPSDVVTAATVDVAVESTGPAGGLEQPSVTRVLRPAAPSATVTVWGAHGLTLRTELATTAGALLTTQRVPAGESVAVVNLPRERFPTVLVRQQDPLDRYRSIDVELELGPGGHRDRRTLTAAEPSAVWTRFAPDRTADGASPAYRYRLTRLRRDGVVLVDDWADAADSLLVVGDRDLRMHPVTVVLTGWPPLAGALLTVTSLVVPEDVPGSAEVLLDDRTTTAAVRLPGLRSAALRYRLTGQLFTADSVIDLTPLEASSEVLIVTPGAGPA